MIDLCSWVPLLNIRCHADTQMFLCSLFAPICLDRPIYPCRSLCQAVQAGCESRMRRYGFPWPDMLRCDQFPLDNDLCVGLQHHDDQTGTIYRHRRRSCDRGAAAPPRNSGLSENVFISWKLRLKMQNWEPKTPLQYYDDQGRAYRQPPATTKLYVKTPHSISHFFVLYYVFYIDL